MTKYSYFKLPYLTQYAKAYYLKILFVSVAMLAGLLIATSCKNKKAPGTAHQSESTPENNPETMSSLNISVDKSQLIDKQKKIKVTITVPASQLDTLKHFKLQVGFLDGLTSGSEISYENQNGQKEVAKSIKKGLTEFKGSGNKATSSKKQKEHTLPITLTLLPSKQVNKLKLEIKLLDKEDQVLKTLEVQWIKSKLAICNLEELLGETEGHFVLKNLADNSLELDTIEVALTGEKDIVCQFLRTGTSIATLRQLLPENMQRLSPDSDTTPIGVKATSIPQGVKQAKVMIKVTQNEEQIILVTHKLTWKHTPKPTSPKPSRKQAKEPKQEKAKSSQETTKQDTSGKTNTSNNSNTSQKPDTSRKKTDTSNKSQEQKKDQPDAQGKQGKTNTNPTNASFMSKQEKETKQTAQPSATNHPTWSKQEETSDKQPEKKTQPSFTTNQENLKQEGASEKQPGKVKNYDSVMQNQSSAMPTQLHDKLLKKPSSLIKPTKGVTDTRSSTDTRGVADTRTDTRGITDTRADTRSSTDTRGVTDTRTDTRSSTDTRGVADTRTDTRGITDTRADTRSSTDTKDVTDNSEQLKSNLDQQEKPRQEINAEIKATEFANKLESSLENKFENKKESRSEKDKQIQSGIQEKQQKQKREEGKQEKEVLTGALPDLQLRIQQKQTNHGVTSKKFDVFVKNNGDKLNRKALREVKLRYNIQGEGNITAAKLRQNRKEVVASGIEISQLITSTLKAGEEKKFELIVKTGDAHSLSIELSLEGVKNTNTALASWKNKQKTKQHKSKSSSIPDFELNLDERKSDTNKLFKLVVSNKGEKLTKKSLENVKISYTLEDGTGDFTDVKLTRRKRGSKNPDIQGETLDKLLKNIGKDQKNSFELTIYSANADSLTFQISLVSLEGVPYTKAVQVNWKREDKDKSNKTQNQ